MPLKSSVDEPEPKNEAERQARERFRARLLRSEMPFWNKALERLEAEFQAPQNPEALAQANEDFVRRRAEQDWASWLRDWGTPPEPENAPSPPAPPPAAPDRRGEERA